MCRENSFIIIFFNWTAKTKPNAYKIDAKQSSRKCFLNARTHTYTGLSEQIALHPCTITTDTVLSLITSTDSIDGASYRFAQITFHLIKYFTQFFIVDGLLSFESVYNIFLWESVEI